MNQILNNNRSNDKRPIRQTIFVGLFFFSLFVPIFHSVAQNEISFWTTEAEQDRLLIQKEIASTFTDRTGIRVRVIPVQENMLREKVTAAYAARSLPDVIFHPIDFTIGWATEGILDNDAATKVILHLDKKTFGTGPLNLVRYHQGYAAVPIDGWGQLLLYRKDLFQTHHLGVPNTWDRILNAAKILHKPPEMWGFEAATDPGQIYTQQVFEHIALSNGVQLVDHSGAIALNTPEMIQTLGFYKSLAGYGPPGNIYWLNTRLDYLSGRAAMIIWSPYILDELSGLLQNQPVIPDIVKKQPGWLAEHTGFVSIIEGPRASAQYGQINYLGITRDADILAASKWIEFLLTDGYIRWMSMAPEGKMPMRKGTRDRPNHFTESWKNLEFGGASRAKISEYYGTETVADILSGIEGFNRWGFAEGKGDLISKIYGTKIIPKILKRFLNNEITAEKAAALMEQQVKSLE